MNVVILHGWMQSKQDWQALSKQLSTLSHIKSVEAFDLPGFGQEERPPENWSIPDYADWVVHRIEKKRLTDVLIIGHSFGGRIAAYIAFNNPSWLKALILSGTPALYRPSTKMQLKQRLFKRIKNLAPANTKKLFYSDELNTAEEKGLGTVFRNVVTFDQTTLLKNITVPTFLIWGSKDDSVPLSIAEEIHSLITDSQLVVINNGTHNSFLSHPYLFLGHVKKFIESL